MSRNKKNFDFNHVISLGVGSGVYKNILFSLNEKKLGITHNIRYIWYSHKCYNIIKCHYNKY